MSFVKNSDKAVSMQSSRIRYIDLVKCLAIYLVVVGHTFQIENTYSQAVVYLRLIIVFHMPLFAILSGMFFDVRGGWVTFFRKKGISLVLPYLVWCAIHVLIRIVSFHARMGEWPSLQQIAYNYWMTITNWGWWFIRALIFCFFFAYSSIRMSKGHTEAAIFCSILILYSLSFSSIIPNQLSLTKGFIFLYPFFCIGILLRKHNRWIKKHIRSVLLLSLIGFCAMLPFWKGYPDTFYTMNTSLLAPVGEMGIVGWLVFQRTLFRFAIGVFGSVAIILLFDCGEKYLPTESRWIRMCQTIGQRTLAIYILSGCVHEYFWTTPLGSDVWLSWLYSLILSVVIIWACVLICKWTEWYPIGLFLWGKQHRK